MDVFSTNPSPSLLSIWWSLIPKDINWHRGGERGSNESWTANLNRQRSYHTLSVQIDGFKCHRKWLSKLTFQPSWCFHFMLIMKIHFYQANLDKGLASWTRPCLRHSNSLTSFERGYFGRGWFICRLADCVVWILAIECTFVEQGLVKRHTEACYKKRKIFYPNYK